MLPPVLTAGLRTRGAQRVVLVIGAGCSVEAPTDLKTAAQYSIEAHDALVAAGAIASLAEPWDLAAVADAVELAQSSRQMLVDVLPISRFRNARPNAGYLIAAALQAEGIVRSTLSLNYDHAGISALSALGVDNVQQVFSDTDLASLQTQLFVFLNGSAFSAGSDFVITSEDLARSWRDRWQQILAEQQLLTPIVVFVGLGSPAPVLSAAVDHLSAGFGTAGTRYLVDPESFATNAFALEIGVDEQKFIQDAWCAFMRDCADAALSGMLDETSGLLGQMGARMPSLDVSIGLEGVMSTILGIGLVAFGVIRDRWFGKPDSESYARFPPKASDDHFRLIDLLLLVEQLARLSGSSVEIQANGLLRVRLPSGSTRRVGLFSGTAMEFDVAMTRIGHAEVSDDADIWVVAHTAPPRAVSPPDDIIVGTRSDDLIAGPALTSVYLDAVRASGEHWMDVIS